MANKLINIFGPSGCGKTHLTNILSKKLKLLSVNHTNLMKEHVVWLKNLIV